MVASTPVTVRITFCRNRRFCRLYSQQLLEITTEPIPATVDQTGATQAALDWARRFYRLDDLEILDVAFETQPTRSWRVTFLVSKGGQTHHLYALVLPNGRPVKPTIRAET